MSIQPSEKPKRRPRRVASDEAHAWARNLRLGNPYGKMVLTALSLYVDGDATCTVGIGDGIETGLAFDTELSPDTVRKRLAWLEQVGAIARFAQWIDASGRRNGDGRGKRTTDDIRLLINADPDEIEARAKGFDVDEISPRSQQGPSFCVADAGPALAPEQPSDSSEGLISEPEPKDSPQSPSLQNEGKAGQPKEADEVERKRHALERFKATHPLGSNHPERVETLWFALTLAEEARAQRGAEGVKVYRSRDPKRPATVVAPENFLANPALWDEFARFAPPEPKAEPPKPRVTLPVSGPEHAAVAICCIIADRPVPRGRPGPDGDEFEYGGDVPAGAAAMAQLVTYDLFGKIDTTCWQAVHAGTPMCAAWRDRVAEWLGVAPEIRRFWLNEAGQIVPTAADAHKPPGALIPKSTNGLLVPVTATGFPPPKGKHDSPGDAEHEAGGETD